MIELKNISKTFINYQGSVEALKGVSLTINDGDIYGIIGMSGAGKSTLVRCINLLEEPTEGSVIIDGVNLSSLSKSELNGVRKNVAMIFQSFNLLMQANCLDNVCFPMELNGIKKEEARKKAIEYLDIVGLKEKANSYPSQLSGGQQQRVAIARALASNPKIILCDEATSALDPQTTNSILDLLKDINSKMNITIVMITHQMSVVENICNRVAILENGEVAEEGEVTEVFSHPKSLAAKKLVFPEVETSSLVFDKTKEKILRVVFNGSTSTGKPLIASLAMDKGIAANIIYASIRNMNQKAYGSLLLGVNNEAQLKEAKNYLNNIEGVNAEEFEINE
ncbi:MAG: ATP-binding cassette domain-containing protein [Erysipelotrichaceae bacterium]|nr:ATP-binding cassette domain-containing protein [Erysipelotrichaceae bacterium]